VTPAEHYRSAESLIDVAASATRGSDTEAGFLREALVHATLALYSPPVEVTMVRNEPRRWPQDHADDVTVVGPSDPPRACYCPELTTGARCQPCRSMRFRGGAS
jgi:hypothetical protein